MAKERPEHVTCINHTEVGNPGTWCGRHPQSSEFAFVSIDHAAYHATGGGRLVPCPGCAAAVVKALAGGRE